MARIGGNPGLKAHQFTKNGCTSKNRPYSIAVESDLLPFLKLANKDKLRKAWVLFLISEGFDIPQHIRNNYQL